MEETPREKRYLSGDSKPSSVMAIGMFGLAMAGYGRKQNCCQIGQKIPAQFSRNVNAIQNTGNGKKTYFSVF